MVASLLVTTAILLTVRERTEIAPVRESFVSVPHQMGNWVGRDVTIPPDVLQVLGPGDFLLRNYAGSTLEPPVNLFAAYFPSQRTGDTIHSPKNCLPGGGWF